MAGLRRNSKFFSKEFVIFIAVFGIVGAAVLYFTLAAGSPGGNGNSKAHDNHGHLLLLRQQLELGSADLKHNPSKRPYLGPQLQALAKDRKAALLDLIKTDPGSARGLILSNEAASSLAQNGADVEQPVTVAGTYRLFQIDEPAGDHIYSQIVTAAGKIYTLDTEQTISKINPGSNITVSGLLLDDQLLVSQATDTSPYSTNIAFTANDPILAASSGTAAPITVNSATSVLPTLGTITQAVMVANFSGGSSSMDITKVKAVYNGTPGADVASFVAENSGGKASLVPTFFGVYSLSSVGCFNDTAEINAMNAAAGGTTALSSYHVLTYVTNCNEVNWATVSGGTAQNETYIGNNYLLQINAHELSHTLGASHGGYLDCAPQVFVSPVNSQFDDGSCQVGEYQDPYDALGGQPGGLAGDLSPAHKLYAGWLDSTQIATVNTTGTSSYTLAPYERSNGLVALQIPRGNSGGYFTLEYRQPLGFDSYITNGTCPYCNASQGALVRLAGVPTFSAQGGTDSVIIDATPGSHPYPGDYWPAQDGDDGALLPGQSFSDPEYGITIKTVSAGAAGLTVQITRAPSCVNAAPTVSSVTPAAQTVAPGQSANYSFTLTNNDSTGCMPDKFRFNPSSGSYDQLSNTKVALRASPDYITLAPGASTVVTLTASSTADTPDGSYYSSNFSNGSGYVVSRPFGSSSVVVPYFSYQVTSPADTTPPSAPTNLVAKALGSAAANLSWSASTDNGGVSGYRITMNTSSIDYTSGTSYASIGLLPNTLYNFSVQAFDHKRNYSSPVIASIVTPAKTDTTPPSQAGNINVSATDHSYTVSWSQAHDNVGIACYNVGNGIGYSVTCGTPASQPSYTVNSVPSQTQLNKLTVIAFDGDGNSSVSQNVISAYTAVQGDPLSPSHPQQLYAVSHTFSGTQLTWQASTDDKAIVGYNIYRGCCKIAYTTSNSYFDSSSAGNFYHVQAVDTDGSVSQTSNEFLASGGGQASGDTTPPSASVTEPANGSVASGTITVQSSVSDNVGVTQVQYYLDGNYLSPVPTTGPSYPLSLDTTKYPDGPHWLVAEAYDAAGNTGSSGTTSLTFNNSGGQLPPPPDTQPPTVSLIFPSAGSTVSGSVNVAANATDNVAVAKVDLLVDGNLSSSDTSSPYSFTWNSAGVANGTHILTANAYDTSNNLSSAPITVNVSNGDTTPPSTPTGLSASASTYNQVNLSWTASTDNVGVAGYFIVRGGVTIAQTTGSGTTYSDTTVNASTSYSYQVIAYDAQSNSSGLSNTASVITPSAADTTAPTAPSSLSATAVSSSQINLAWGASSDNIGVTSYDIYRNSSKIASVSSSSTSFGDSGLAASTSYSYFVIARDAAGNSSPASNPASATTQTPPPPATTGSITGTINSSMGGFVSGATIQISYSGSRHSYSSDSNGVYTIASLPAGTYNPVKYSARGFNGLSLTITVIGGQTTTQNVTLVSRK